MWNFQLHELSIFFVSLVHLPVYTCYFQYNIRIFTLALRQQELFSCLFHRSRLFFFHHNCNLQSLQWISIPTFFTDDELRSWHQSIQQRSQSSRLEFHQSESFTWMSSICSESMKVRKESCNMKKYSYSKYQSY